MTRDWLVALVAWIRRFVEDPAIQWFYVGRAADPARRGRAHQCCALLILAGCESVPEAMAVEAEILRAVGPHRKCRNRARHAGGGLPRGPGACAVYLALWP